MAAPVKLKVIKTDSKIYLFRLGNVVFWVSEQIWFRTLFVNFLVGVEVPFKNCDWFSKYLELLTPWYADITPKYILVHLDYGNSWPFSVTQRVKGRRSPALLWSTPAENPGTIALWYWLQPFAQLVQVRLIASNNDRLFNLFCWTNKPFHLDHNH